MRETSETFSRRIKRGVLGRITGKILSIIYNGVAQLGVSEEISNEYLLVVQRKKLYKICFLE
uniref:Uncharacterized protein n=1 Tax=Romanomermis culicivorax TaxID=13658 RepID=A0A915I2X1_ROMCU